jgi:hypothetical protein
MNNFIAIIPLGLEFTENPHFQGSSTESLYNSPCYVVTGGSIYFNRVSERPLALMSRFPESLMYSKVFLP